jgi:anti-anti-sigma factor
VAPKERSCLAGRYFDYESVAGFQTELDALVADMSVEVIVVDCRDLTFIDSSGFRMLLSSQHLLESQGRRLRVTNLSAALRHTFDLVGVSGVLRVGA